MKGINAKKIAAFVGAAVLFGAAAVAAEVTYGSTQLVDQSGQPTVKIYVGSHAAISDGVAAANIAAKIANEAYKSSTLTSTVSGTPTCTAIAAAGNASGAGSCSIVESSKKVTFTVAIPGSVSGTHVFKTLITDTIDRALANRNNALPEDLYPAALTSTDTSGTITSPLRAVETGLKGQDLYRIGSGQFTGFSDYAIIDNQAASTSYTEEQSFWIGSQAGAIKYDSSSSIQDVAVNKYSAMVYSTKFTGNDYGIPVCTGDLPSNDTSNWAGCGLDSNSRTDKHRVQIKFMGADWIISELTSPTASQTSSTSVANGGQVKLAKEAKYGIVNVGSSLDTGVFKIRLTDISVAVGSTNTHPAIIDVLDSNDATVGQIQVDPGQTYTFTQSGTSNSVKIHVYKTAPGFTLNAKWAEMAVYTDEITLKDNSRYNLVSSTSVDKNFKVSLLWKNRDYSSSPDSTVPDSLREIVVYNVDGFDSKTKAGDVANFPNSSPLFKLTYQGVDLTDGDYAPITYSARSSDSYRIATTPGDIACGASSTIDATHTSKMIEISTEGAALLGGTGDALSGDYLFDKVLYDPIAGQVFYKISGRDCYNWDNVAFTSQSNPTLVPGTGGNFIKFDTAGDNSAAQGALYFSNSGISGVGDRSMFYQEDAGKFGTSSNNEVYIGIPVITTSGSTYRFRASDSATENVFYYGLGATEFTSYEPTFVSERGSKVLSVGTTDVSFDVAKRVGMPTFQFAYADATTAAASADDYIMGVGESHAFGDTTITVKSIDVTAGSCNVLGAGGAPTCSVDSSGVTSVISPNNVASVVVTEPYKLASKMVLFDSDAVSGVAITVGGPLVNTVTADALKDAAVNFDVDTIVVREVGNKIVIAGKTAQDTMAAADQFIAGVKRQ